MNYLSFLTYQYSHENHPVWSQVLYGGNFQRNPFMVVPILKSLALHQATTFPITTPFSLNDFRQQEWKLEFRRGQLFERWWLVMTLSNVLYIRWKVWICQLSKVLEAEFLQILIRCRIEIERRLPIYFKIVASCSIYSRILINNYFIMILKWDPLIVYDMEGGEVYKSRFWINADLKAKF